jgi:hypothetical protein
VNVIKGGATMKSWHGPAFALAFAVCGIYGFFRYALPVLLGSPPINPEVVTVQLLAWIGGMLFFAIPALLTLEYAGMRKAVA